MNPKDNSNPEKIKPRSPEKSDNPEELAKKEATKERGKMALETTKAKATEKIAETKAAVDNKRDLERIQKDINRADLKEIRENMETNEKREKAISSLRQFYITPILSEKMAIDSAGLESNPKKAKVFLEGLIQDTELNRQQKEALELFLTLQDAEIEDEWQKVLVEVKQVRKTAEAIQSGKNVPEEAKSLLDNKWAKGALLVGGAIGAYAVLKWMFGGKEEGGEKKGMGTMTKLAIAAAGVFVAGKLIGWDKIKGYVGLKEKYNEITGQAKDFYNKYAEKYNMDPMQYYSGYMEYKMGNTEEAKKIWGSQADQIIADMEAEKKAEAEAQEKVEVIDGVRMMPAKKALENYARDINREIINPLESWVKEHPITAGATAVLLYKIGVVQAALKTGVGVGRSFKSLAQGMLSFGIKHPVLSVLTVGGAIYGSYELSKDLRLPSNLSQLSKCLSLDADITKRVDAFFDKNSTYLELKADFKKGLKYFETDFDFAQISNELLESVGEVFDNREEKEFLGNVQDRTFWLTNKLESMKNDILYRINPDGLSEDKEINKKIEEIEVGFEKAFFSIDTFNRSLSENKEITQESINALKDALDEIYINETDGEGIYAGIDIEEEGDFIVCSDFDNTFSFQLCPDADLDRKEQMQKSNIMTDRGSTDTAEWILSKAWETVPGSVEEVKKSIGIIEENPDGTGMVDETGVMWWVNAAGERYALGGTTIFPDIYEYFSSEGNESEMHAKSAFIKYRDGLKAVTVFAIGASAADRLKNIAIGGNVIGDLTKGRSVLKALDVAAYPITGPYRLIQGVRETIAQAKLIRRINGSGALESFMQIRRMRSGLARFGISATELEWINKLNGKPSFNIIDRLKIVARRLGFKGHEKFSNTKEGIKGFREFLIKKLAKRAAKYSGDVTDVDEIQDFIRNVSEGRLTEADEFLENLDLVDDTTKAATEGAETATKAEDALDVVDDTDAAKAADNVDEGVDAAKAAAGFDEAVSSADDALKKAGQLDELFEAGPKAIQNADEAAGIAKGLRSGADDAVKAAEKALEASKIARTAGKVDEAARLAKEAANATRKATKARALAKAIDGVAGISDDTVRASKIADIAAAFSDEAIDAVKLAKGIEMASETAKFASISVENLYWLNRIKDKDELVGVLAKHFSDLEPEKVAGLADDLLKSSDGLTVKLLAKYLPEGASVSVGLSKFVKVGGVVFAFAGVGFSAYEFYDKILEYEKNPNPELKEELAAQATAFGVVAFVDAATFAVEAYLLATAGVASATILAPIAIVATGAAHIYSEASYSRMERKMEAKDWHKKYGFMQDEEGIWRSKGTEDMYHEWFTTPNVISTRDKYAAFYSSETFQGISNEKIKVRAEITEAALRHYIFTKFGGTIEQDEMSKDQNVTLPDVFSEDDIRTMMGHLELMLNSGFQIPNVKFGREAIECVVDFMLLMKAKDSEPAKTILKGNENREIDAYGPYEIKTLVVEYREAMGLPIPSFSENVKREVDNIKNHDSDLYAVYNYAKFFGYPEAREGEQVTWEKMQEYFSSARGGQRGLYYDDGTWYVNEQGLEWDDSMAASGRGLAYQIAERLRENKDDIFETRADSMWDFYGEIGEDLQGQSVDLAKVLEESKEEFVKQAALKRFMNRRPDNRIGIIKLLQESEESDSTDAAKNVLAMYFWEHRDKFLQSKAAVNGLTIQSVFNNNLDSLKAKLKNNHGMGVQGLVVWDGVSESFRADTNLSIAFSSKIGSGDPNDANFGLYLADYVRNAEAYNGTLRKENREKNAHLIEEIMIISQNFPQIKAEHYWRISGDLAKYKDVDDLVEKNEWNEEKAEAAKNIYAIFNNLMPKEYTFINGVKDKESLAAKLTNDLVFNLKSQRAVQILNEKFPDLKAEYDINGKHFTRIAEFFSNKSSDDSVFKKLDLMRRTFVREKEDREFLSFVVETWENEEGVSDKFLKLIDEENTEFIQDLNKVFPDLKLNIAEGNLAGQLNNYFKLRSLRKYENRSKIQDLLKVKDYK